jgi:hypothetical protein
VTDYTGGPGPSANSQDSYSVGSLISGILAVLLGLFCGILAIPTGILAIVLGVMGRKRLTQMGKGTGIATTGIALGVVAIVLTTVFLAWAMLFGGVD